MTQKERIRIWTDLQNAKAALRESDYKAIKYAEGLISEEDYASIKAERQALRDKVNELQAIVNEECAKHANDVVEEPTIMEETVEETEDDSK